APDHARRVLPQVEAADGIPVTEALADALTDLRKGTVHPEDVDWSRVPDHLKVTFRVERTVKPGAKRGRARGRVEVLAEGKDLRALQQELAPQVRTTMARAAASIERQGLTTWDLGE